MADLQKTIEIIFAGTDKTSTTIRDIAGGFSAITDGVEAAAQPLANIAELIEKVILGAGGLGLAFGAFAVNEAKEFQAAGSDLQKVLGENQEQLDLAKQAAKDYALTYGEAATSQLASTATFVQAGFGLSESLGLVKTGLDLVIAGEVSAEQSTDILIKTLKGFGFEASEASHIVDILNAVSNKYATDSQKLGDALAIIAPIAKLAGLSIEEMTGFITPVIEVFQSGTEAGNAFKTGLLRLSSDSKPVVDALKSIGISQKDANGELKTSGDILKELAPKFGTLTDAQQQFIAQEVFGIYQTGKLVSSLSDYNKILEITATAQNSAGSAAQEVAIRLESLETKIGIARQAFNIFAQTFGDQFISAATGVVGGFTDIEVALTSLIGTDKFKQLVDKAKEQLDNLQGYLVSIAQDLPEAFDNLDFSRLLDALSGLGGEIGDIFASILGDIDLTTVDRLTTALQAVVNGFAVIVESAAGIVEAFQPFFNVIGQAIQDSDKFSSEMVKDFGNVLGAAQAITTIGLEVAGALALMNESGLSFKNAFEIVFNSIALGANSLQITFDFIAFAIIQALRDLAFTANEAIKVLSFGKIDFNATVASLDNVANAIKSNLVRNSEEANANLIAIKDTLVGTTEEAEKAGDASIVATDKMKEGARSVQSEVQGISTDWAKVDAELASFFDGLVAPKNINVNSDDAQLAIARAENGITDLTKKPYFVVMEADTAKVDKPIEDTKQKLTEIQKLAEKKLEIEADFKIEQLKQNAAVVQKAIEWKAKVDIAEVEAAFDTIKSESETIGKLFESTGEAISAAFGILGDFDLGSASGRKGFNAIIAQIEAQNKLQERALTIEERLANASIAYMDAKRAALQKGDGMITVSGQGLEPHIEAFMFEILKRVQVQVTEEQSQFLLGL